MTIAFLSDQCVPDEIVRDLRAHGYAVTLLRDVLPVRSPDPEVIAAAQLRELVLLSLNGDFADIYEYPPTSYSGIVAIQLRNHPEAIQLLMERFRAFLSANPERDFYRGKLVIVEPHRIRLRQ